MIERSVGNFETRRVVRSFESDSRRRPSGGGTLSCEKITYISRLIGSKTFVTYGENFIVYTLRNLEPVKRFENVSYVVKFRRICYSTSSRIENKLKTIKLICRKVKKKGVAVVKL